MLVGFILCCTLLPFVAGLHSLTSKLTVSYSKNIAFHSRVGVFQVKNRLPTSLLSQQQAEEKKNGTNNNQPADPNSSASNIRNNNVAKFSRPPVDPKKSLSRRFAEKSAQFLRRLLLLRLIVQRLILGRDNLSSNNSNTDSNKNQKNWMTRLRRIIHDSFFTRVGLTRLLLLGALLSFNLRAMVTRHLATHKPPIEIPYSAFLSVLNEQPGVIQQLRVSPTGLLTFFLEGDRHTRVFTRQTRLSDALTQQLLQQKVSFSASAPPVKLLPMLGSLFYLLFLSFTVRKLLQGPRDEGAGRQLDTQKFKQLSFADVAGQETAAREVAEVCDMLLRPQRYASVGARLPSGVLLSGPPGSGKTLLARVAAAEAKVPFFACSATDFVEVFVGRGPARVRKLFQQAAKQAPCIVFIDELDSVGRSRRSGGFGNNAETENTLNALLTMMDGLDTSQNNVIVMAATNRAELLDPALLRAGRFDRIVNCPLPDAKGRRAILEVHIRTRRLTLASPLPQNSSSEDGSNNSEGDVTDGRWLDEVARSSRGMAGADLAALVNEAAIRAARRQSVSVAPADFDAALRFFLSARPALAAQNLVFLASAPLVAASTSSSMSQMNANGQRTATVISQTFGSSYLGDEGKSNNEGNSKNKDNSNSDSDENSVLKRVGRLWQLGSEIAKRQVNEWLDPPSSD